MTSIRYDSRFQHLLHQYMDRELGGGNLHIVLEDGNLEDHHIEWCIQNALDEMDGDAAIIGNWLLKLTEEEREDVYNKL